MAGVAHGDLHIVAGLCLGMQPGEAFIDMEIRGVELETSPFGHGVAGVHGEVQQHLFNLGGIAQNGMNVFLHRDLEMDGFWKCRADEICDLGNEFGNIHRTVLGADTAGESENLTHELGGTEEVRFHCVEHLPTFGIW